MGIQSIVDRIRANWTEPRKQSWVVEDAERLIFDLSCRFQSTVGRESQISEKLLDCPSDLKEFWDLYQSADLFQDKEYGQWGLHILSPTETLVATEDFARIRHKDFRKGDIICGRFYGDSDLLIARSDPMANDYGNIVVADPIDRREDWSVVSDTFTAFLDTYDRSEGAKYWELRR